MWTGVTASVGAYRKKLDVPMRVMVPLVGASIVGGLMGAVLLLKTPAHTFMRILPWLMLGATLLFAFGKKFYREQNSSVGHNATTGAIIAAAIVELFVATYGGYFGAGMGFVILAMLALLGMTDIHSMNAVKTVLSSTTNGLAVLAFIVARAVYWPQAVIMLIGAIVGGYVAAHYAQRLPQSLVRGFVISLGIVMTIYFFVKAY